MILKITTLSLAIMVSGPALASDRLKLPIGECVAKLPNNQCGVLTVRSQSSMSYMAGRCNNGKLFGRVYKSRKINRKGNTITVDDNFIVTVKWVSPLQKSASVHFRYTDKSGTLHTGNKSFKCL